VQTDVHQGTGKSGHCGGGVEYGKVKKEEERAAPNSFIRPQKAAGQKFDAEERGRRENLVLP